MHQPMRHDSITEMLSKPIIILVVLTIGLILLANLIA